MGSLQLNIIFLFIFFSPNALCQSKHEPLDRYVNGIYTQSDTTSQTTENIEGLIMAGQYCIDSGFLQGAPWYLKHALKLSVLKNDPWLRARSLRWLGNAYYEDGLYPEALENLMNSVHVFDSIDKRKFASPSLNDISFIYGNLGNFRESVNYVLQAYSLHEGNTDIENDYKILANIADSYSNLKMYDSAEYYASKAKLLMKNIDSFGHDMLYIINAEKHFANKEYDLAIEYFKECYTYSTYKRYMTNDVHYLVAITGIAKSFFEKKQYDSSLNNALNGLENSIKVKDVLRVMTCSKIISNIYEGAKKYDSAFLYNKIYSNALVEIDSLEKASDVAAIAIKQALLAREYDEAKSVKKEKAKSINNFFWLGAFFLFAFCIYLIIIYNVYFNRKFTRLSGIFLLLVFFELINLIIHYSLAGLTNHSELIMLALLVGFSIILVPLHHKAQIKLDKIAENSTLRKSEKAKNISLQRKKELES